MHKLFTVNLAPPTLTSISPNSGVQGQGVAVTLTGTNFVAGATIGVSGAGITVSNTTVASATQITATFTIAGNAPTGAQNITVTTSGRTYHCRDVYGESSRVFANTDLDQPE